MASDSRSSPPAVSLATTVASLTSSRSRQSSSSRASEVADLSAPGASGHGCAPSGRSIVMQR
ncbi:MAG TPA: hypothetical protein VF060_20620 [Trebonia sp.]